MVSDLYVGDIKPGMDVNGVYVLRAKKLMPFRNGNGFFLGITLADKTGQMESRFWEDAVEINKQLEPGDVLQINGQASEYNGILQVNIKSWAKSEVAAPERFVPSAGITASEVKSIWLKLAGTMKNKILNDLLVVMAQDNSLMEAMAQAPGAKQNHHAWLGGLWQHSFGMVKAAIGVAKAYPDLDRDLLVTGALLHDLGKIEEYQVGADIGITDAGRLLGHIVLGVALVDKYIQQVDSFPEVLRLKLLHMIVSHHGKYEWQSPKKPKFIEAAILHQLDMLDAQNDMFGQAVASSESQATDWTDWVRPLERYVYKK